MSQVKPDWIPEIGEVAHILPEVCIPKDFKNDAPSNVGGHFPLIMHITPGEEAKDRYVWFFVLHSHEGESEKGNPKIHFQYLHVGSDGKHIAEHAPTTCSTDCKDFLFLKPTEGVYTKMNVAGWVDISKLFELPLDCLRPKLGRQRWYLRDCSISLLADRAVLQIADRVARWQPRSPAHVLCQKLDPSRLQIQGLVCWVETVSRRLIDSNGISYAGYGPCILAGHNLGTAKVYDILDLLRTKGDHARFAELRDDEDIITAMVRSYREPALDQHTWLSLTSPTESSRDEYLPCQWAAVLEPGFEVSIDALYELPSCYLPSGTRVCTYMIGSVGDFAQADQARVAACVKTRSSKGVIRHRAAKLRLEREIRERRQKVEGEQDYEELLRKTETGIALIKDTAVELSSSVVEERSKGVYDQTPEQKARIMDCLESHLLMCAALAQLKQEGALPRADEEEDKTVDQDRRSRLTTAIGALLMGFVDFPPDTQANSGLQEALGSTAAQCNPYFGLMNVTRWPTWEDFS